MVLHMSDLLFFSIDRDLRHGPGQFLVRHILNASRHAKILKFITPANPSHLFNQVARRDWVNIDVDKIECESCNTTLEYLSGTHDHGQEIQAVTAAEIGCMATLDAEHYLQAQDGQTNE